MKYVDNLRSLSPDLYLRYHYGFEIIKNFQKNKPCQILDVGGRSGIMGDLIKTEKLPYVLTVIDSLPDNETKTTVCDKYIKNDFLKFDTNTKFDYLVTFDVLEHVSDKKAFISKCLSLCDKLILTAPFKSKITNEAENIVNQYFLQYKGVPHPWLKEHFEQGLPDINWLENYLSSLNIKYKVLESNNIENWVNFMLPNLLPALYQIDSKKLEEINLFYNQNYQELGDHALPTYRKIFVISANKTNLLPVSLSTKNTKPDTLKKIIFTNMVIDFLTDTIKKEKDYINQLDSIVAEKTRLEKDTKLLNFENTRLKKEIGELKIKLIKEKNFLEKEIKVTKKQIDDYTNLINQITTSNFFKLWQSYNNFKKFLTK